ncbi:MAG: sodium/substrate symporter small subunit [Desulfuromonadales bacterium]
MRREVRTASTVLLFWFFLSFGIPVAIWLAGLGDPSGLGESFLTRARFLGFPLHYWLIAQGCTIGYVLLCKLYCLLCDRRFRHASGPAGRPGA